MKPGKYQRMLFAAAAAALVLSALYVLWPARRENLEEWEYRVKLPPAADVPDADSAVPGSDIKDYWKGGRMVWVQPVVERGPVKVELSLPRPTLAIPPMPLPDPAPLLEHSGGLPRWGEVPRPLLEEIE